MTYANYNNAPHTSRSYTNSVYYRNAGTTPYGFISSTAFSYTNYCNTTKLAPGAIGLTATTTPFSDNEEIGRSVVSEIAKLRTDLETLSVNKVGKTAPISFTPTFVENTDAKLGTAQELKKAQITEMTNKVKELWRTIKGETAGNESGTWPNLSATNPATLDTDYKQLIQNTQQLASIAQPRTWGYLNCCNVSATAGSAAATASGQMVLTTNYNNGWTPSAGSDITGHLYSGTTPTNLR